MEPVKLISIDITKCSVLLLCGPLQVGKGGGLGLKVQTQLAGKTAPVIFSAPTLTNVNTPLTWKTLPGDPNIIKSLGDSLANKLLVTYTPQTGNITNDALAAVAGLVNQITTILSTALKELLSNLLDPIVNSVLSALGVGLANAEIGANLSCNQGGHPQLVL